MCIEHSLTAEQKRKASPPSRWVVVKGDSMKTIRLLFVLAYEVVATVLELLLWAKAEVKSEAEKE